MECRSGRQRVEVGERVDLGGRRKVKEGTLADYRTDPWRDLRLRNLAEMSLKGSAQHAWGTIKA